MTDRRELRWGIVGPGEIAGVFAEALSRAGVGRVASVYGRTPATREAFAERYGGVAAGSIDAVAGDDGVDAVYIATPHASHADAVRRCLAAGTPALCEKPMTLSAAETLELTLLASDRGVFLAEAWMHRTHPQMAWLVEIIRSGEYGRAVRLESCFGFAAGDRSGRLFDPELGGGSIFDVGGYPVSLATLIARANGDDGQLRLVDCQGEVDGPLVDTVARATLESGSGFTAHIASAITEELGMHARIEFARATVTLHDPFLPQGGRLGRSSAVTIVHTRGEQTRKVVEAATDCYALEARAVAEHIDTGSIEPMFPMVDHAESVQIATLLDQWRRAVLPRPGSEA